jgi:hypothetical protein
VGGSARRAMACTSSLAELDDHLATLDLDAAFPDALVGQPRGRTGGDGRAVSLPEGWLDTRESRVVPFGAEMADSGG